ncbi:MAG: hypothetical protein ACJ79S_13580 [Gemmatimonadaceae bacterium]
MSGTMVGSPAAYAELDAEPRAERDALLAAVRRAPRRHFRDDAQVRAAVVRYAAAARSAGLPPERLIVRLKALAREAAADVGEWYRSVLTDRIVVWAIEGYYAIPDEPHA